MDTANLIRMALNCRDLKLAVHSRDLYRFRNVLNLVRTILDNMRRIRPSLEDALRSSVNLEKKLNEYHLDFVARFEKASDGALFLHLAKADADHVSDLEDEYRKLVEKKGRARKTLASGA